MADDSTSRRQMLLGSLFLGLAGLVAVRQPVASAPFLPSDQLEQLTPRQAGPWRSDDSIETVLPPPDALSERLYDNLVARAYVGQGELVILMVLAYSSVQDGMFQIHRPEICYPAGGFRLTDTVPTEIKLADNISIPGSSFVANGLFRSEHVLYWTRQGTSFPQTWTAQRMSVVRDNIRGKEPDGMLARFSTINAPVEQSTKALERFIEALLSAGTQTFRDLLTGPLATNNLGAT